MSMRIEALRDKKGYAKFWGNQEVLDASGKPVVNKMTGRNYKRSDIIDAQYNNLQKIMKQTIADPYNQDKWNILMGMKESFGNNITDATQTINGQNTLLDAQKYYEKFEHYSKRSGLKKNSDYKALLGDYKVAIDSGEISKLDGLRSQLNGYINAKPKTQNVGMMVSNAFNSMIGYYDITNFMGLQRVIGKFKELTNTVAQVDAAMISLKKVTSATDTTYDKYLDNAISRSKQLSVSVTDYIKGTTEFAKLGYNIQESQQLGQVALKYANVGDGVQGIEGASSSLIATLKAFKLESKQASNIADKYNAAGNNFAISAGDAGQIMQKSAAALNSAGNDIDQSLALGIGMAEVNQDAGKTGSALKTVALRLRGSKAELESEGESSDGVVVSTSKLRAQIKALTKTRSNQKGVDILDAAGNYKSTYEIMQGIASVWQEIGPNSTNGAALLELIAGKNRSSDVAGMLNNWESVEKAYTTMQNATGSVNEEYGTWSEGIQAKKQRLQSVSESFATSFADSDGIKAMYDLASGILELITKATNLIGSWPSIAATIGGLLGLSNGSSLNIFNAARYAKDANQKGFSGTMKAMWKGTSYNENTGTTIIGGSNASGGLKQLASTLGGSLVSSLVTGLIFTGLSAITKLIKNAIDKDKNAVEAGKAAYESLQTTGKTNRQNAKYVKNNKEEFARLYQGVGQDGQNKTLTEDEYSSYTTMANKLAQMFPILSDGVDESGNAILNLDKACSTLGVNADTTVGKLQNLSKAYQKINLYDSLKDIATIINGYRLSLFGGTNVNGFNQKYGKATDIVEAFTQFSNRNYMASGYSDVSGEIVPKFTGSNAGEILEDTGKENGIYRTQEGNGMLSKTYRKATNKEIDAADLTKENLLEDQDYYVEVKSPQELLSARADQLRQIIADAGQSIPDELREYLNFAVYNSGKIANPSYYMSQQAFVGLQDKMYSDKQRDKYFTWDGEKYNLTGEGESLSSQRQSEYNTFRDTIGTVMSSMEVEKISAQQPLRQTISAAADMLTKYYPEIDEATATAMKNYINSGNLSGEELLAIAGANTKDDISGKTYGQVMAEIYKNLFGEGSFFGSETSSILGEYVQLIEDFNNGQSGVTYKDIMGKQAELRRSFIFGNEAGEDKDGKTVYQNSEALMRSCLLILMLNLKQPKNG